MNFALLFSLCRSHRSQLGNRLTFYIRIVTTKHTHKKVTHNSFFFRDILHSYKTKLRRKKAKNDNNTHGQFDMAHNSEVKPQIMNVNNRDKCRIWWTLTHTKWTKRKKNPLDSEWKLKAHSRYRMILIEPKISLQQIILNRLSWKKCIFNGRTCSVILLLLLTFILLFWKLS